jgi:AcrR family transcriptional regulator
MGRPRTTSDDKILEAARKLFREAGHAVATREVAREAGVSQAVLYQRFPSKTDLFFAAMTPTPPDVDAILGEATMPVDGYLEAVALRVLKYFESALPTVVQLMAHPEFDAKAMGRLHEGILAERLVSGLASRLSVLKTAGRVGDVDPKNFAHTLIAALHSFVVFHVMSGTSLSRQASQIASRVVDVLWKGAAPRPQREGALTRSR